MKYQCECGRQFIHPAKQTTYYPAAQISYDHSTSATPIVSQLVGTAVETSVCPYCQKPNYDEIAVAPEQVEGVYVHDLTSGAQPLLDEKLKEGWRIQGRYAKQYILEKVKTA